MGSLANLRLPQVEIEVPGAESFSVRGLSLSDVSAIMRNHGQALNEIYVGQIAGADELPDAQALVQTLMHTAPSAVAEAIAIAADEPEAAPMVARLPFPIQVNALVRIAELTFHSEEAVGNLMATVIQAAGAATRLVNPSTLATSTAGSGDSDGSSLS